MAKRIDTQAAIEKAVSIIDRAEWTEQDIRDYEAARAAALAALDQDAAQDVTDEQPAWWQFWKR